MSVENVWSGRQSLSRTETLAGIHVGHDEGRAAEALWIPEMPPWMEQALCAQTDPDAFFPEKGGCTRDAKLVCRSCPVRTECLDHAVENGERFGIWGGLSERERRKLRKRRAA